MTQTTDQELYEQWSEDYALTYEPNYDEHLEADCKAAFLAGMQAARSNPVVPKEPTSKQVVLGAGALLGQPENTADNRHPDWHSAVDKVRKVYIAMLAAAPVQNVEWDGKINPSDFVVSTSRQGGSGWVSKPDNCIRITHLPTGLFEEESSYRSQHTNKAVAWQRLSDRLEALAATQEQSK